MAAAAERGIHASRRGRTEPAHGAATVHDATFLSAILPYALSQALRHCEPLTVFCTEIDRLTSLVNTLGTVRVDMIVGQLAEAIARTLRGCDVIARLDDNRVVIVLPNTGSADALRVAAVVRSALTSTCLALAGLSELSVSMGVACFPEDGHEMVGLLAAADDAMTRARAKGCNNVATASPSPIPTAAARAEPSSRSCNEVSCD
jgi:diguanylate cyclase (GGDEF)-like protein